MKSKIKYIVLCKGIPLKINPYVEFSGIGDYNRYLVSVDGLLCFLSQTNPNFSILDDVFGMTYTSLGNPYFYVDKNFSGTYRFKSDYFGNENYKINYLVSRLDGLTYNDAIELIDRNTQPELSGNNLFLLDAHLTNNPGVSNLRNDAIATEHNLSSIGYDNLLDLTDLIYYSSSTPVIGYTSSGKHAGMPYWYNYLFTFEKPNGSVYNTYESFNGFYMDTLNLWNRQDNQGMITEWVRVGGSGGAAHTYEPTTATISKDSIFFPLYSIGYSMVDAAYQGIPYLAFRNVVIGDPLTTIAWGKQTTTKNISMSGTNLVTDTITINTADTLTFTSGAHINLKHHGFVTGSGTLQVESNVIITSIAWQRALLLAAENNHPKLVWSVNPDMTAFTKYRIYRKIDTKPWKLIDSTTYQYYLDNSLVFSDPEGGIGKFVQYYIVSINNTSTSVPSNTVSGMFNKAQTGKIILPQTKLVENYCLSQNYPNPFNPSTEINYAIREAGLVKIKVYDILGNEVAVLVNETKEAGYHSVKFNASKLPSGVYIYTLHSGSFSDVKKMILIK